MAMCRKIFLTFDCEDFINARSVGAIYRVLKLLRKYNLRALFFITGHMAEKLTGFPKILDMLEDEEIGYHSSAHSVRPAIFEYTDIEDYTLALQISIERETKHINPLTGETRGKGGLKSLRELFPGRNIVSFRAPGLSWSPPHLEALVKLGIRFDFSADLSATPFYYRGVTFYPYPIICNRINVNKYMSLLKSSLMPKIPVLLFHPSNFANRIPWDTVYLIGNPKKIQEVHARSREDTEGLFRKFESLLRKLSLFAKRDYLEITPPLEEPEYKRPIKKKHVLKSYRKSIEWPQKRFRYEPRLLRNHFLKYFEI